MSEVRMDGNEFTRRIRHVPAAFALAWLVVASGCEKKPTTIPAPIEDTVNDSGSLLDAPSGGPGDVTGSDVADSVTSSVDAEVTDAPLPSVPVACLGISVPAPATPVLATQVCGYFSWPQPLEFEPSGQSNGLHHFKDGTFLVRTSKALWRFSPPTTLTLVAPFWGRLLALDDGGIVYVEPVGGSTDEVAKLHYWDADGQGVPLTPWPIPAALPHKVEHDSQGLLYSSLVDRKTGGYARGMAGLSSSGGLLWQVMYDTKDRTILGLIPQTIGVVAVWQAGPTDTILHFTYYGADGASEEKSSVLGATGNVYLDLPPIVSLEPSGRLVSSVWEGLVLLDPCDPSEKIVDSYFGTSLSPGSDYGITDLVRTDQGYLHFLSGIWSDNCTQVRTWDKEGRPGRRSLVGLDGCSKDKPIATGLPNGGFAYVDNNGLYLANANGSITCKGCGPPAPDCDDKDACTTDTCDPGLGDCIHVPVAGCIKALGTCITAEDCDDGSPCTVDVCDKATGACTHSALAEFDTGDPCLDKVKCVAGVPVAPIPDTYKQGSLTLPGAKGWNLPLDSQRPQVFEANGHDVYLAGGWYVTRVQHDGVVLWKRETDGGIGAATVTPDDGMLVTEARPKLQAKPGETRLVRYDAKGKIAATATAQTGLPNWWLGEGWQERKQWLVPSATGYTLVGTTGWTADGWQGRLVSLDAQLAVVSAVDVTFPGFGPGTVPKDRAIDEMWPAPDGGILLGWHKKVGPDSRIWGAARLAASGKLVWQQPFPAGQWGAGAFDHWRPQGIGGVDAPLMPITQDGLGKPGEQQAPNFYTDPEDFSKAASANLTASFAKLPNQAGVHAQMSLTYGLPVTHGHVHTGGNQPWNAQVPHPTYPNLKATPLEIVRSLWENTGLAITDVYMRSDGYPMVLFSSPPGVYFQAGLLVLDNKGLFRTCGTIDSFQECKGFPFCIPCLIPTCD
jgi:hypothetical protein